jgi:hypothetical protein
MLPPELLKILMSGQLSGQLGGFPIPPLVAPPGESDSEEPPEESESLSDLINKIAGAPKTTFKSGAPPFPDLKYRFTPNNDINLMRGEVLFNGVSLASLHPSQWSVLCSFIHECHLHTLTSKVAFEESFSYATPENFMDAIGRAARIKKLEIAHKAVLSEEAVSQMVFPPSCPDGCTCTREQLNTRYLKSIKYNYCATENPKPGSRTREITPKVLASFLALYTAEMAKHGHEMSDSDDVVKAAFLLGSATYGFADHISLQELLNKLQEL